MAQYSATRWCWCRWSSCRRKRVLDLWRKRTHLPRLPKSSQESGKLLTPDAESRASEGNVIKTHNPVVNETHNPVVNVYPVDPASSFRVDGKINGRPVSFLLDTGAAVSLIRKDIWDSLEWGADLTTWSSDAQLVGMDGSPYLCVDVRR